MTNFIYNWKKIPPIRQIGKDTFWSDWTNFRNIQIYNINLKNLNDGPIDKFSDQSL